MTWNALSLRGLDVALAPGAATTVTVAETALTDFFARAQIDPSGRFNLQDLVKSSDSAPVSAIVQAAGSAAAPAAPSAASVTAVIAPN